MTDDLTSFMALLVLAGSAIGVLAGWLKWIRPWWRRWQRDIVAGRDALVGRPPVVDSITGRELSPAVPGIGRRMATVEEALITMAQNHHTLNQLQESRDNHEDRIKKLEDAAVERVAARVDSIAAWRAMETAHQADPDTEDPTPTKE